MRIFIIHGSGGKAEDHWRPWLRESLRSDGHEVIMPQFPIGNDEHYEQWRAILAPRQPEFDDAIFVGHSLGVPFILRTLDEYRPRLRAALLVGGFVGKLFPSLDEFSDYAFDWAALRELGSYVVINSDNDPYVPLRKGEELAAHLDVDLTLVRGAGHFQAHSGFTEFPLLLERIRSFAR